MAQTHSVSLACESEWSGVLKNILLIINYIPTIVTDIFELVVNFVLVECKASSTNCNVLRVGGRSQELR